MSSDVGNPGKDDNEEDLIQHTGSMKNKTPEQQLKAIQNMKANDEDEVPSTPIEKQEFFTGDKVEALYENTNEWFRGKVIYVQYDDNKATHFDVKFNDYGKIQKSTPLSNIRSYKCEHEDSMQKKAYTNQCPVMEEAPYEDIDEHLIKVSMSTKNRSPQRLTADYGKSYLPVCALISLEVSFVDHIAIIFMFFKYSSCLTNKFIPINRSSI